MTAPAIVFQPGALPEPEMRAAITRYGLGVVREWRDALEAVERRRMTYPTTPDSGELAQLADHMRFAIGALEQAITSPLDDTATRHPSQLAWHDLTAELARDEQAGWALWQRAKAIAAAELMSGQTAGEAVESRDGTLFERAQFVAMRDALADGLQPRNGLEWLMLDEMAQALTLHRRWLAEHVTTSSLPAKAIARDAERRGEWSPPRLTEAETADRAAMHADRALRAFLRLLKAYRDGRKLIGTLTVTGGQVNVGEQQVIASPVSGSSAGAPRSTSPRRERRKEPA